VGTEVDEAVLVDVDVDVVIPTDDGVPVDENEDIEAEGTFGEGEEELVDEGVK
jgi:hypothetical protein